MMFRKKIKNEFSLLPHIKTDIYGFNSQTGQVLGWEITKLDIDKQWIRSQGEGVTIAVIDTGVEGDVGADAALATDGSLATGR